MWFMPDQQNTFNLNLYGKYSINWNNIINYKKYVKAKNLIEYRETYHLGSSGSPSISSSPSPPVASS